MESIGQKLTASRESHGFTIEQIARETNIAKSYLQALEQEAFDQFPGETYLLGFLRNYSDYLGLDPEEMVSLYKNMMIQEQPAPIEELLDTRKQGRGVFIVLIIVAAVLAVVAGFYFYIYPNYIKGRTFSKPEVETGQTEEEKAEKRNIRNVYEFTDEVLEKSFNLNDAVNVTFNTQTYQLYIAEAGDKAVFSYPQGKFEMKGGEEKLLDLDGDSSADLRIILRSINPGAETVVLHLDRFVQTESPAGEPASEAIEDAAASDTITAAGTAVSGEAGAPSRVVNPVVVREAATPEPFTLNIIFRGYCMLRYETDQGLREERYFLKGEVFRLNADKEVRLWVSNAGTLSGKINGVDISLGGPGEVSSRIIRWEYNEENSVYQLMLLPLY